MNEQTLQEQREAIKRRCFQRTECFGCPISDKCTSYAAKPFLFQAKSEDNIPECFNIVMGIGSEINFETNSEPVIHENKANADCEDDSLRIIGESTDLNAIETPIAENQITDSDLVENKAKPINTIVDLYAATIVPPTKNEEVELHTPTNNNVDHPSHYQGPHECIDVMRALFGDEAVLNFCRCNSFKYRFRADAKNKEEDIKKAEYYEHYIIKMLGIKPIDYKENNDGK